MAAVEDDTIGGFNTYVRELGAEQNVEYRFTLTLFDTRVEARYVGEPLSKVAPLSRATYVPGGGTALYDALGATVRQVEQTLTHVEKVITVIMTDGHENSSREWTQEGVQALIAGKEKEGNWTFVFLGATPDAWDVGMSMGVQQGNRYRYQQGQVQDVLCSMSRATNMFSRSSERASHSLLRSTGVQSDAIEEEEGSIEAVPKKN